MAFFTCKRCGAYWHQQTRSLTVGETSVNDPPVLCPDCEYPSGYNIHGDYIRYTEDDHSRNKTVS